MKLILLPGGTNGPGCAGDPPDPARSPALGAACVSCFPAGSLCGSGTSVCYELPVLDTVFVRKKCRRQGLGTAMLQDFCDTFQEDEALGVSFPISPSMYQGNPNCVLCVHLANGGVI